MYEVFLTAIVDDSSFSAACAVLSGLCGMRPWQNFQRVLYFHGPPRAGGMTNQANMDKPMRKDLVYLWKEISQNLLRQSYVIQARYDVPKDPQAAPMDLLATPGMLRWTDFPEPPHGRPMLTQRKKIEIWEQRNLPLVLRDNNYQFKTEIMEEVHRFYRDDVEFCLFRSYFLHPQHRYVSAESKTEQFLPLDSLPPLDSLVPIDMEKRWFLHVKTHVMSDNKPDDLRKAQDQLLAIRAELEGVFDFRSIDRKVYDTRIAQQAQGIQALPQKVVIGKN
ncbi:hypothetical protein BHE90_000539 [Fusarium euwallaceae]|uniref:Mediator of RNA polymerase II transcription subunit 18 n=4 Tax=Fusarium solani species complex TaxID=232080 RepID=A0A3M2S3V4_9HYPO|nr:hypothetical protein CDV36_008136 [Fusarium kuroshium]RSL84032.1 hypothetical protein CEP51_004158 [Fusarium floridanum]RSL86642.1 hypothetical protein CEP52_015764 [Fusarium oligoseptatum]RTE84779.1 hypothetical protein BHE90_000539 [Fusarium euwallaceae]